MVKKVTPSWGCPTRHILKYCQLLDISGNYERISMKSSGISLLGRRREIVLKNTKICHPFLGLPRQPQPPNSKTRVISANYKPISTKFSGFSVPTRWQRIGEKNVEKCHPSWGCPTPHIFKFCQLLDISGNYERISMKFSGISLLAWGRKLKEYNTKICHPLLGLPRRPNPSIIKHALSRPIMNRFLLNFQELVSQQFVREQVKKMLKNAPPAWGFPTPHIFKFCQLLDISGNYERISMKFSGISLLARRRKLVKNIKICYPLLGLPQQPQPSILKHALSRPITNRFLLLQHIYCLTQCIGSHCDTVDIVIRSTVYIILAITWSSSDPTVVKKFQQQADREGRRNGGRDKWKYVTPLGGGHSRLFRLSPRPAYGMCVGLQVYAFQSGHGQAVHVNASPFKTAARRSIHLVSFLLYYRFYWNHMFCARLYMLF